MAGFITVGDIIAEARILLQDTEAGNYRWNDTMLYNALNEGLLSSGRARPDFFRGLPSTPQYAPSDIGLTIVYPDDFKPALVNYVCGRIQLQDDEASNDQRAIAFITAFGQSLTASIG